MKKDTVTLAKFKMAYLKNAIKKLNKKAVKLGCAPMVLTFHDEFTQSFSQHPYTGMFLVTPLVIEFIHATLEYDIPIINGYSFIAKLDIYPGEEEDVVMISSAPGVDVPEEYKNLTEIHCDHCGYNRRRYHSVLLQHEDGSYKQVGSTCVKDFFGHDPKAFLFAAGIDLFNITKGFDEEKEWSDQGGRALYAYDLEQVIQHASACVKKWGWTSKGAAYENPGKVSTADDVFFNLNPAPKTKPEELAHVDAEDKDIAVKTIEYFKGLVVENNDYLLNCQKLTKLGYVPYKQMGFACSMVIGYRKHLESELERQNTVPSNHVGSIGERLKNLFVKVTFKREIPSQWDDSISMLYSFKDVDGNIYKTFYSGYKWNLELDDEVTIAGTVKKHDEFKGQKQTMLNRVAVA